MPLDRFFEQRDQPYAPEQLFSVAADIEAYPDFVPLFIATRIRARDGNVLSVDNVVRAGPARFRFETRAEFRQPHALHIAAVDGPFETLTIDWRFRQIDEGSTTVSLEINRQFRSGLAQRLANLISESTARDVLNAFEAEAAKRFD